MTSFIGIVVLALMALLFSNLRSVYQAVPVKELHRRAKHNDPVARLLAQVASHGRSAEAVLMGLTLFFVALTVALVANVWRPLFAIVFIILFLFAVFVWSHQPGKFSRLIAYKIAPYFASILLAIEPLSKQARRFVGSHRPVTIHTGLYDKEDLLQLFETQKVASGNHIEQAELDIAKHALLFGDKLVKDYMTPRRVVRFVAGDEPIGPILISELHDSGFSRFPVRGDDENTVVGTLYLRDLVSHNKGGIIKNAMKPQVFYVNEASSLESVLPAFIRTKHHLFMVVNEFEEIVGIITIEDVLEQIIGRKIVDEFDQYEDLRAVAKLAAKKDQSEHPAAS